MGKLLSLNAPKRRDFGYVCVACGFKCSDVSMVCEGCGECETMCCDEDVLTTQQTEVTYRRPQKASEIQTPDWNYWSTGFDGWNSAIGGGLVRPSTVLVHGPKGSGKSRYLSSIAVNVAIQMRGKALYGSAEMPKEMVRKYLDQEGFTKAQLEALYILDDESCEGFLEAIRILRPVVVVWDSVQCFTVDGEVGELSLRHVVKEAKKATKKHNLISLLVSQVTKENEFLGPSEFGHGVDCIVEVSRDDDFFYVNVPEKNRFAKTPGSGKVEL